MDKSEECENKNEINHNSSHYNNSEVMDKSISDPIPSLFLPIKKNKKSKNSISEIIANLKKNKYNLNQIQKEISRMVVNNNLSKHNSTPEQKNMMLVNDLIESKETHFIAVFKDYLINDYEEEFLRRYFDMNEAIEVLPKFYQYYKNYLTFFCKGIFTDFDLNKIMQEYGESQAEFYYNRNYGHNKEPNKKKDKKENLDNYENSEKVNNNKDNDNNNPNNKSKLALIKTIFTQSIEYSIERIKNSKNDGLMNNEQKEISNIKPNYYSNNKDNTIVLPDNSSVSSNDIITKENSIRYIINLLNRKKQRMALNKKIKNTKKDIIFKNIKNNTLNKKANNGIFINKSLFNKKAD